MRRYEMYKDSAGDFRWRFIASNGRIVADSAEGYTTKAKCKAGIRIMQNSASAPIQTELGEPAVEETMVEAAVVLDRSALPKFGGRNQLLRR